MAAIPGAPSSVFAIASGICFGKLLGFTVSFIGFTIGNIITVLAITKIDGLISSDKHHGLTDRIMKMQHPRIGLIIGYMVPFIPTVMTSIAAVKMNISRWQLITCIIIGSIPASLLYALGGDQLMHQHWSRGIVLILLSILLAVLLVVIFIDRKKIEKKIKTEH